MNAVTAELLERIAVKRRFSSQTLEIAKRLFLYRDAPRALSAEYGVNLARVYAIRETVSQAAKEERLPPGWEEVTLIAPKELIDVFRQQIAEAQARLERDSGTLRPRAGEPKQDGNLPRPGARKGKV